LDKPKTIQELKEALDAFRYSETASMTLKELLTGTANIALPTAIQARALLTLQNWVDLRPYARRVGVPKGVGKTASVQVMTQPDYNDWTEGTALAAADPTLAKVDVTIAPFGKNTKISDLLANVSAIDFVEEVGRVHGGCVAQGIFDKIVDALAGATGNSVSIGTKGDATEANFTFANVSDAIAAIMADGERPDFIATAPDKLWTCFATDYDRKMFYGSLNDFLMQGVIPKVFGLTWLMDVYFEKAINAGNLWNGTDGEKYAVVGTTERSVAWASLQDDPVVEVYRKGDELSNYVITHMDGGAAKLVDNSICIIKHAA